MAKKKVAGRGQKNCPKCGEVIGAASQTCKLCGKPISSGAKKKVKKKSVAAPAAAAPAAAGELTAAQVKLVLDIADQVQADATVGLEDLTEVAGAIDLNKALKSDMTAAEKNKIIKEKEDKDKEIKTILKAIRNRK